MMRLRLSRSLEKLTSAEMLLPLAAVTLEICWVYPWMMWVSTLPGIGWESPPISLFSSFLMLFIAYVTASVADSQRASRPARVAMLVADILLVALLLRLEQGGGTALWGLDWLKHARAHLGLVLAGTFYGLYLLWRGFALGREPIAFDRLNRTFTFGLAALGILLVLWGIGAASKSWVPLTLGVSVLVAAFFFAGLAGLALSNYLSMQQEARRLGRPGQPLSRRWVGLALIIALLLSFFALAIARTVALDASWLARPLVFLADGIGYILVYAIGYPLGYAAQGIVFVVNWLLSIFKPKGTPPQIWEPPRLQFERTGDNTEGPNRWAAFIEFAQWSVLALIVMFAIYLVVRAYLRSKGKRQDSEFDETSESLWSKDQFWTDFWSFFRNLFSGLRRRRKDARQAKTASISRSLADESGTLTLREIYGRLLWEGRRAGNPRAEAETPSEYATRLERALPSVAEGLRTLTNEYETERYGYNAAAAERVPVLNQLWRKVRLAFPGNREKAGVP